MLHLFKVNKKINRRKPVDFILIILKFEQKSRVLSNSFTTEFEQTKAGTSFAFNERKIFA